MPTAWLEVPTRLPVTLDTTFMNFRNCTDGAVATSGTAARGAHLFDPHTRQAVGRPGSTSVVGPDLLWSDIWATALFVGGATTRAAFAEHPAYEVVDL